jgi:ABC-type thiamine transport system ATPase subunit
MSFACRRLDEPCLISLCVVFDVAQSTDGEVPHLLFHGPSGAGKKTRILSLLRAIYGPGITKVKLETRTVKLPAPSNRTVEISSTTSMEECKAGTPL